MQHLMRSSCRSVSNMARGSGSNHPGCGCPTTGRPWTRSLGVSEYMVLPPSTGLGGGSCIRRGGGGSPYSSSTGSGRGGCDHAHAGICRQATGVAQPGGRGSGSPGGALSPKGACQGTTTGAAGGGSGGEVAGSGAPRARNATCADRVMRVHAGVAQPGWRCKHCCCHKSRCACLVAAGADVSRATAAGTTGRLGLASGRATTGVGDAGE